MTSEVLEKIMLAIMVVVIIPSILFVGYTVFTTSFACAKSTAVVSEAQLQRDALIEVLKTKGYVVVVTNTMACAKLPTEANHDCSFLEGYSPH